MKFEYKITLIYLLIGSAWIIFSDQFLNSFIGNINLLTKLQTYKGWFYVLVTALVFFQFTKKHLDELRESKKELENHKNNLASLVEERTEELDVLNKELVNQLQKEKELEMQLAVSLSREKEINQLKSKFIATVSHEFRTPLASLSTSSQMIQRYADKWSKEKLDYHHTNIEATVDYLTQLLDDVLTSSRTDKEFLTNNPEPIIIQDFLQLVTEQLQLELKDNHNLTVINELTNPVISIDKKLFTHIITNLLSNAIKYSPNGGDVVLSISSENNYINIKVSDSGLGIPADEVKYIFDAFYRAQNTPGINGSGLGLNMIQRAVKVLGGDISVETKENIGTTFLVKIPIA